MPPKRNTKKSIDDEAPDATPERENIIVVEKTVDNTDIVPVSDANIPIYPYVNKVLSTSVMIEPMQLNNKLEYHIKNNLKILHEGKIFKNYGYINKIHKVEAYTKPIIEAENFSCSAITKVKFSFEMCVPTVNKYIICKVTKVVKEIIRCSNGSILSFINPDRINNDVFYKDQNRNFRIRNDENSFLAENMFVKIFVLANKINFKEQIIAIGRLDNIATEDEVNKYYYDDAK